MQSEVRLWARSGKWFSFTGTGGQVLTSTGTGTYTFSNVPAGDYLVDCRRSDIDLRKGELEFFARLDPRAELEACLPSGPVLVTV